MSDPIEKLTRLGDALEGAPMPLPASEIRARGDRIRRRKHAVIAGASAAVVAAVAVPVIALAGGSDGEAPVSPQPTVSDPTVEPTDVPTTDAPTTDPGAWPTTIPDGFPLASGWPADEPGEETTFDPPSADNQAMIAAGDLRACGTSAVDPGPVDRLTTRFSDVVDFYIRELQLFPGEQEAITYLAHLRTLYGDCPTEGATPTFTTAVADGAVGEESVVITSVGEEIYRTVINVVRVGNAVVVDLKSDEGLAADIDAVVVETRENLADVIGEMGNLQGGGVSGNPGSADPNDPAATTAIPADFPLASYPAEPPTADSETTITGPEPGLDAVGDLPICGVAPLPTEPADRLGYSVSGIEYGDHRELRTYPTAQAAVDELELLRDLLADCDREPTEQDGWSKVWRVFDADTGYDSVTFGYTTEMDDSDSFAPSGQLMTAVRVGSSILVVAWYAEYSAESMADNVPGLLDTVALVTPAMCVFTADGC